MESRYSTLKKVFDLVIDKVHPTKYRCPISEVLVHGELPWDRLVVQLDQLSSEELVELHHAGSLQVSITEKGIEKIRSLGLIHQL